MGSIRSSQSCVAVPQQSRRGCDKGVSWLIIFCLFSWPHINISRMSCRFAFLFWKRFVTFQPDHPVFSSGRSVKRVIPFLSHGDEGRTKKKRYFLLWSFRSVAGSRTRFFRSRPSEEQTARMPLNLDSSLRSRFLRVGVPNKVYNDREDVWQAIASRIGQAYHDLEKVGFEYNGQHWHMVCLGLTRDSPFIVKAGFLLRNFGRVPKTPERGLFPLPCWQAWFSNGGPQH